MPSHKQHMASKLNLELVDRTEFLFFDTEKGINIVIGR